MNALRTHDYLLRSRDRLFDAVRPLTAEEYGRAFSFGLKTIGATVTHIMISEWYYFERLTGRTVPPYESWAIKYKDPPAFGVARAGWACAGGCGEGD